MRFRAFGDERAASQVLGVILMIAVTVSLAGVVHAHAVDFGDQNLHEPAPKAAFTVENADCSGTQITHEAGDSIPADELYVRSPELSISGPWADPTGYSTAGTADGTVQAGDRATLCNVDSKEFEIQLVWKSDQNDRSVVLSERELSR
ncbi:type IV pilin [Natrialbaceae archaeon A-arb3/5]